MSSSLIPAALIAPLLLAFAAPVAAAGVPIQYRAELAAPAVAERIVVRDTVWHCEGGTCVGPKSNSIPAVLCAALVRETGPVRSFAVDGRPLPAEQLEKCNARAR
ncbi:MAG: putative secreted protein [Alphaproteobacteria bacterium]|nr:putative secreted protein [Alphaproteobacteria bacterium]